MSKFPKHYDDLLENTSKPNHAIMIKNHEKQFENYVNQHFKNKIKQDEYIYNMKENMHKKKLKDVQNYQKLQIVERDHIAKLKRENDRKLAKEIISRDLQDIDKYNELDLIIKKSKQLKFKEMLDEQAHKDQQARENNIELEHKEYALNTSKIKDILHKY